ncbi:hypothetical protein MC885_019656, partial [Smutsia gigantea]
CLVTSDGSNRTWGRSTVCRQEEFEDVKRNCKKKGCTWGPNSIPMKERTDCRERIRPLSDGNSPWSTLLIKNQKTMPLASLFVDQPGACEEPKLPPDGLEHRKPKQMKLPSQAHVDPPLWREGPRESPVEPEGWAEGSWGSPAASATRGTPTDSLSRSPQRKKTEAALFGCIALLASVALGLDIRELSRAPAADELLSREDRKKREGIFQRAAKSHSSTSPAAGPTMGEGPGSPTMLLLGAPIPLNVLPSAKGGLPARCGDSLEGSAHFSCDPEKPAAGGDSRGETSSRPALGTDWRAAKAPSPLRSGQPCCTCSADGAVPCRPTVVEGSTLRPTGAPMVSATGASDMLPEQICGIPHSPPGPHSHLPREVLPETPRAVLLPQPPALKSRVEPPHAFPQRTESQPTEASPTVYGLGPMPPCSLCAMERIKPRVPFLLDADVADQSGDCTLPLCRIKSRAGGPSIREVGREFMS